MNISFIILAMANVMLGNSEMNSSFFEESERLHSVVLFQTSLNIFIQCDPQKLPNSPYNAFNNSPNNLVDLNGEAPLTAADILVPEFGETRIANYARVDRILSNAQFSHLYNHPIYQKELTMLECRVNEMISDRIPKNLPLRFKQKLASVYKMSRREIVDIPRHYEEVHVRRSRFLGRRIETVVTKVEHEISYNYYHNFTELQDLAALSYLENTGIARSIFEQEAELWNDFNWTIKSSAIPKTFMQFPLHQYLIPEEMARLYENDEYMHAVNLRDRLNSEFAIDNEQPSHSILKRGAYGQYTTNRGHNVTAYRRAYNIQSRRIQGIPESAISIPYRPLLHLPILK